MCVLSQIATTTRLSNAR